VRIELELKAEGSMSERHPVCGQCLTPAVIRDRATRLYWCLGCAVTLLRAGDPVTDYEELDGGAQYAAELARGTSGTLRLR
jgi:hypothetical protein